MEELKKIHGAEVQDLRSVPFNVDATYARYPKWMVSEYINYCLKLSIVSL
jgi:hypothetical protein